MALIIYIYNIYILYILYIIYIYRNLLAVSSAEPRPPVVEALLTLPSQALLSLCHLDNDLVIIDIVYIIDIDILYIQ